MTASEKLTSERFSEIMAFPATYDEDCPKLAKEQIARLRPAILRISSKQGGRK